MVYNVSLVSLLYCFFLFFFFSSRRRHTRSDRDWSSDVCSSDLDDYIARRRFPDARADTQDGLRLAWRDRWLHVRPSNTEPIIRLIAEAPSGAKGGGGGQELVDEARRICAASEATRGRGRRRRSCRRDCGAS